MVSGLPALAPIHARITLCENMDPNFLVGKVLQDAWNWSIRKEYLEADCEAVETESFNLGFPE